MWAKGSLGITSYTRMCGDSKDCPSNLHIAIPYRDGSTKARLAAERQRFCASRWENKQFRAFSVRERHGYDGRVRSCAPRVVLRSENSWPRVRILILKLGLPV